MSWRMPVPAILMTILGLTPFAHPRPVMAIPDPTASDFPGCLVLCPAGDIEFPVVVRDINGSPQVGVAVTIDLCAHPSVALCAIQDPPNEFVECDGGDRRIARQVTDSLGRVRFSLRGGGSVGSLSVRVRADNILLALVYVSSPDQDGDLVVDAASDGAILDGKLGTMDATGDLDCAGTRVDAADRAILDAHAGHTCDPPVPVEARSWGFVKDSYR